MMCLKNKTEIEINCLERLLQIEGIGILSKKVILKELEKLRKYYEGLCDGCNCDEDEEDDDWDWEWDDDDDDDYYEEV